MSTVVLTVHHERKQAHALAHEAIAWLQERGISVVLPRPDAEAVGRIDLARSEERLTGPFELGVSLGGDGTMLRSIDLLAPLGVPVLGVNVGLLGYLTTVEPSSMIAALERFFVGDHDVEERMMLEAYVEHADAERAVLRARGLNEAVLEKTQAGHTVRLLVSIAGEPFTSYAADGLIVATPTGSTAYSLSARGPILSPRLRALVLTPVSPHMLFDRPLVLSPDESIVLEVIDHRPATLTVDGRAVGVLTEGDRVTCRTAPYSARLVTFGERHFHQLLKAKFGLSDR